MALVLRQRLLSGFFEPLLVASETAHRARRSPDFTDGNVLTAQRVTKRGLIVAGGMLRADPDSDTPRLIFVSLGSGKPLAQWPVGAFRYEAVDLVGDRVFAFTARDVDLTVEAMGHNGGAHDRFRLHLALWLGSHISDVKAVQFLLGGTLHTDGGRLHNEDRVIGV